MNRVNLRELHHLVAGLLDADISDADFDRLQFLLRDDPECRVAYHEYCQLHIELQWRGTSRGPAGIELSGTDFVTALESAHETTGLTETEVATNSAADLAKCSTQSWPQTDSWSQTHFWLQWIRASQWIRAPRISTISALAFGLSACLLGIFFGQIVGDSQDNRVVAPPARNPLIWQSSLQPLRTIATFASGVNAKFRNGIVTGSRLGPGRVQLEQGIAEIVFDRGAVLVLKGPAELDLIDESSCYVLSGAVSAKVGPDAHGFVVQTDALQVSEFDAEFGLRTTADAMTELHVFDGELRLVDVRDAKRPIQRITRGNALRFGKGASADAFAADPTAFISRDELARRKRWQEKQALDRWQHYSFRWLTDPATILRYDFTSTDDGSIFNVIASQEHLAVSRQSVPRWVEGRWTDKQAMLFDGRTDMLRVPDHHDLCLEGNFSMAVWIKARSTPPCWNRIVGKGTGADRNYGLWMNQERELLWQVCPDKDPRSQAEWDRSGVLSHPIPLDRWVLAVGVIAEQRLEIYVNGELHAARLRHDGDGFAKNDAPLTIGYYGNVSGHNAYFGGEIDELLLLRRALSSEEVREMYEAGRPGLQIVPLGDDTNSSMPYDFSI